MWLTTIIFSFFPRHIMMMVLWLCRLTQEIQEILLELSTYSVMFWATAIVLDPEDTVAVNQKPFPLGVHILARQSGHPRKSIIMAKNDKGYEDK